MSLTSVIDVIRHHGTDAVFALLGDANLHLGLAIDATSGMRLVNATHEASAVAMATGYAQRTGRVGVATVTRGPGLTNSITALTEATKSNTPLMLIVGDRPAGAPAHPQDIDHRALVAPTGAAFIGMTAADDLVEVTARAMRMANARQQPTVLNVPADTPRPAHPETDGAMSLLAPAAASVPEPDTHALDRAVGIALSSNRPIVLAGRGALVANAGPALATLAARLGAGLATTLPARGVFAGDPGDMGVFGTLSTPAAVDLISSADCLLAFGASLNRYTTADGAYLKGRAVVQCDVRAGAVSPASGVTCEVPGDAGATAAAMLKLVEVADTPPRPFRAGTVEPTLGAYDPAAHFTDAGTDRAIDPRTLTLALPDILPSARTVVVDAGRFMRYPLTHLPVGEPRALLTTLGYAPIGLAVPTAIGAATGRPDQMAVAITGDGGLMLGGLAEFNTAVRECLDVVVIVFNDGSYGAEHSTLLNDGLDPSVTLFAWPDLAAVANALGGHGVTVRTRQDLELASEAIRTRTTPVLIDCHIDPQVAAQVNE